jgi:excisionase family DNA binding protein
MQVADRYRTVPEVAREFLVSRRTIYRAIERGELPAVRIGKRGRIRVSVEALETLICPARAKAHIERDQDEVGEEEG